MERDQGGKGSAGFRHPTESDRRREPHVKRLFYVRTPLQALIVNRILERDPGHDTLVYDPTSASEKHLRYFEKTLPNVEKYFLPNKIARPQLVSEMYSYFQLPSRIRRRPFDAYYLGSIGAMVFALLFRRSPSAAIRTFDDGTFNIDPVAFDDWIHNDPIRRRMFKSAFGLIANREIVERSEKHYTIFDRRFSLMKADRVAEVQLVEARGDGETPICVLLGAPAQLFGEPVQAEYARVKSVLNASIFVPHPIGKDDPFVAPDLEDAAGLRVFVQDHIAEDIASELCRRGFRPTIYGFGSTTLLNVNRSLASRNIVISGMNDSRAHLLAEFGVETIMSHDLA